MCHPSENVDPEPLPGALRDEVAVPVRGGPEVPARLCVPAEGVAAPRGAVILATDIFGANAFYRALADRLAAAGIAALLPDLFFREGPLAEPTRELAYARRAKLDDERALRELGAGCDWLRETFDVAEGRVGTLGFCLGGNLVLHLAARRRDLATVSYYAFPAGLPAPKAVGPPREWVDRMQGPILGLWGERDEKVGLANVEEFERLARQAELDYEHHVYAGCDHGFLGGLDDPDRPDRGAAIDAWSRTLRFLEARLGRARRRPR